MAKTNSPDSDTSCNRCNTSCNSLGKHSERDQHANAEVVVLDCMKSQPEGQQNLFPAEIAEFTHLKPATVRSALFRLDKAGEVFCIGHRWAPTAIVSRKLPAFSQSNAPAEWKETMHT